MQNDDGTSTGEYYAPTDEYWYNKCIWKCQLCGNKNKSLGSSKKHIHKGANTFHFRLFICEACQSFITSIVILFFRHTNSMFAGPLLQNSYSFTNPAIFYPPHSLPLNYSTF